MTEKYFNGIFEWYNNLQGYGVIRGADGEDYFAHKSNLVEITRPEKGLAVSFLARPRLHNKDGMEAYAIRLGAASAAKPFADQLIAGKKQTETEVSLQRAALEALRLKRERREGLLGQPMEDMPPGTRVAHPQHGFGTVVLASRQIISVRLDEGRQQVVDLKRDELSMLTEKVQEGSALSLYQTTPSKIVVPSFGNASSMSGLLREMASDVRQKLTSDGLEPGEIYRYEEPEYPVHPPADLLMDLRVAMAFSQSSGITKFYSHQVAARQALLRGKHVLISTPTASGKTEAYNPTILEHLLMNPDATALYLFPLVALGFDQTERLKRLNNAMLQHDKLQIGILNNNVPLEEKRQTLRANNRILVTTPESLHYMILPKSYSNWKKFFRNLRYIVVDEAHLYKGVFGANMANIIRRLLARCRREGNPKFPQVIISSATIRHPEQLASQLTGLPALDFEIILESGAPKPGKHLLVTRSDIHDLETICTDFLTVNTRVGTGDRSRPVSMIVFLRSINEVKRTTRNLREHFRKMGRGDHASLVDEYYADKADKSDVLTRLKNGEVRCICTTNALMAGIDIGSLDVAIVKNFPRLIMDARQMFGRAGRASEGAVIFIADRTDPFDQFYFEKPELLFKGPTEDVVANPENPILLGAHLLCAAQVNGQYNREGPLGGEWAGLFGRMGQDMLERFVADGTLQIRSGEYHLQSQEDPHDTDPLTNIRAMNGENFSLKDTNGQLLEEKRLDTAYRDAHRDAIVWVNGQTYKVIAFNTSAHEITCQSHFERDLRTRGEEEKSIEINSVDPASASQIQLQAGIEMRSGSIEVTTNVSSYLIYKTKVVMQCRSRACKYESPNLETSHCLKCGSAVRQKNIEEVVDRYEVPTPPTLKRNFKTRATWLDFPLRLRAKYSEDFWPRWASTDGKDVDPESQEPNFEFAIHSLKHSILKAFPEYIRCDPDEIAGYFELDVANCAARLFIYDNFPGGLGLSDELIYDPVTILSGALDVIERCTCIDDEGCPVCLAYFGCQNFNHSLSKLTGRYLLRVLLALPIQPVLADLKEYVDLRFPAR